MAIGRSCPIPYSYEPICHLSMAPSLPWEEPGLVLVGAVLEWEREYWWAEWLAVAMWA